MSMMHGDSLPIPAGKRTLLKQMQLYAFKGIKLIPQEMSVKGYLKPMQVDAKEQQTGQNAMIFHVFAGDKPFAIDSAKIASSRDVIFRQFKADT